MKKLKLEDMSELQQRDILGLYDLGVELSVGETTCDFYKLNYDRYRFSYDLLTEEIAPQLQAAKNFRRIQYTTFNA